MISRAALLTIYCLAACAPLTNAHSGTRASRQDAADPIEAAFAAAPFQQWAAQGPKSELPWHLRIPPPKLTLHQRIAAEIQVELDGNELVKRCCDGQAIALLEISDAQGHTYRNFVGKDLKDAQPAMRNSLVNLSWQVFLLPSDYQATVAFYYSGHRAHSLAIQKIHVAPIKHDPLPDSWRDLPPVEFGDPQPEGLDEFLLPNLAGRLRLSAKASRPIRLEILENLTAYPSERRHAKLYTDRLGFFLPILKTFAQLDIENGAVDLSILDFTRRSVIFDQQDIKQGQVSWANLKGTISANSVTAINVHDLQQEEQLGDFFRDEMTRRLDDPARDKTMRVFLVISGPMDLGSRAPNGIAPPAGGNFAVFYLRCDFLYTSAIAREGPFFASPVSPSERLAERSPDGIAKALKQLKPKLFAVDSAQSVREALAAILAELSRL